jgi:hypothetical protein
MRLSPKLAVLALVGASAFAVPATAATYRHDARLNYRVVEIAGSDHLNLRTRPTTTGRVIAEIPFDQRGLAATGEARNGWIELRFWDEDGRAITGWASERFLEADSDGQRMTYAVTGLGRSGGLEIRREEGVGRRVGTLAWNATGIESRGACSDLYCPVRFYDRSGSLRGWVQRENLKVERVAVVQPADEPYGNGDGYGYEQPNTSDNHWDELRRRREERRERWRAYWRRLWNVDRHASY